MHECCKIGGPVFAEDPCCPIQRVTTQCRNEYQKEAVNRALISLRKTLGIVDSKMSPEHAAWVDELKVAIAGLEDIQRF